MPPSLTPPANEVGKQLVIDIHDLKTKSLLGRTVGIQCVDEYSGDLQFYTSVSKSARHLFEAMMMLIHLRYSKYNHRVTNITCDSEPSMKATVPLFAEVGIVLTFVDPGQSAQRIEAYIKYQDSRKRAILASLPYVLPDTLDSYLIRWTHDNANGMSNSRSYPSTPDVIITGRARTAHYRYPAICFGATCMIGMDDAKMKSIATLDATSVKNVDRREVGVLVGYSADTPGDYTFLIANGKLVDRKNFTIHNIIPFGWKPRSMIQIYASHPDPNATSFTIGPPDTVSAATAYPPIQLPAYTPNSDLPENSTLVPPYIPPTDLPSLESDLSDMELSTVQSPSPPPGSNCRPN
jgi:hypothetical protein